MFVRRCAGCTVTLPQLCCSYMTFCHFTGLPLKRCMKLNVNNPRREGRRRKCHRREATAVLYCCLLHMAFIRETGERRGCLTRKRRSSILRNLFINENRIKRAQVVGAHAWKLSFMTQEKHSPAHITAAHVISVATFLAACSSFGHKN